MSIKRNARKGAKLLSLLLAVLLAATMVPALAFANDSEESTIGQDSEQGFGAVEEGDEDVIQDVDPENPGGISTSDDESGGSGDAFSESTQGLEPEARGLQTLGSEIGPLATTMLTAQIHDDTGWKSITDNTGDTAHISYNGAISKIYDVEISLARMPEGQTKVLEVSLPVGMAWNYDGYSGNIPGRLTGPPVMDRSTLDPVSDAGYSFQGGTNTYTINENTTGLTLEIRIAADTRVAATHIANALTATLTVGTTVESVALDTMIIDFTPSVTLYNATRTEALILLDESYSAGVTLRFWVNGVSIDRLANDVSATVHLSDTRAVLALASGAAPGWTLTSQGSGDYVVTYAGETRYGSLFDLPLTLTCQQPLDPGDSWKNGDTVSITVKEAQASYASYPGTTVCAPQEASNTGGFERVFRIAPEGEKVFVGYSQMSTAMAEDATSVNRTELSALLLLPEESGRIGSFSAGNAGSENSAPKTVKMEFDTDNARVMAVQLPIPHGQKVKSIKVNGVQRSVDFTGEGYNRALVTYAMLGLSRNDAIATLEYDLDTIPAITMLGSPAGANSGSFSYYGMRLTDSEAVASIEIADKQTGSPTSGVSTVTIPWGAKYYARTGIGIISASQVQIAGKDIPIAATLSGYGSSYQTENPVIYIRIEAVDETGTPLEVQDIHLDTGETRGSKDITPQLVITDEVVEESGKQVRIVTLDTKNITDGSAFLGGDLVTEEGIMNADLRLSYTIKSTLRTDGGTFTYGNMIFVGDPEATVVNTGSYHATDLTNSERAEELGAEGTLIGLPAGFADRYYMITEMSSMIVETFIKQKGESSFSLWSSDSSPLVVGSTEATSVQVKERITNNSGVEVAGPVEIYIPVPKVGDNWGDLTALSEFSLKLTGAVSAPAGVSGSYAIFYGESIIASDNGQTLRDAAWTTTPSNWADVNCVKVVATNVPVDESADFILNLMGETPQSGSVSTGIDSWNAFYFQSLVNSKNQRFEGWYHGSPIGLQAMFGSVKGQLFLDTNANSSLDVGEELAEVWEITVYHKDDLTTPLQTIQTATDGSYQLDYLQEGTDNYRFVVENTDPAYRFCAVVDTEAGNQFAGNADHTVGTAVISPVIPDSSGTVLSEAHIGIKANLTDLTFKSQDTSQGTIDGADTQGEVVLQGTAFNSVPVEPGVTALTGYSHSGWSLSQDGSADPLLGLDGPFGSAGLFGWNDTTYWATFEANEYTVHFDRNDTTGRIASATQTDLKIGDTVSVPAEQTRPGYTFLGWSLDPAATQPDSGSTAATTSFVMDEAHIDELYAFDTDDEITLYAVWSEDHTLTYHGNGNTGGAAPASVTQEEGSSLTVSGPGSLVRNGYIFLGWATHAQGPVAYGVNASLQLLHDMTLYAVWSEVPLPPVSTSTYSVIYAAGGESVTGLPANQSDLSQGMTVVAGGAPARAGYSFVGWISSQGGFYQAGATFVMPAANVVLTARWDVETLIVTPGVTGTDPTSPSSNKTETNAFTVRNDPHLPITQEELNAAAAEQNIPSFGVSLFVPQGFSAWALLNLILMAIGIIMTLVFAVLRGLRKQNDEQDKEKRKLQAYYVTNTPEQGDDTSQRRSPGWLIGAIVLAVVGVIIFILTEDITLPMVWVDYWTILQAFVLIVTLVLGIIASSRNKESEAIDKDEDKDVTFDNHEA